MSPAVCLISREYPPDTAWGGIARAVEMEAHALASAGAEVHVISLAPDGVARSDSTGDAHVHRIAEPASDLPSDMDYARIGLWSRAVAERYWELDSEVGFDVVEAPDYHGESLHLYRRPETPLVVWLHTLMELVWEREGGLVDGAQRGWAALERAAAMQADLLVGPSELIVRESLRVLGPAAPPARAVPYLFDPSQFPTRDATGPRAEVVRALFLGRLEPRKGIDLTLRAVAAARARGRDVRLRVVGRDDFGHGYELGALQDELGLDAVEWAAETDARGVLGELHAADVALLPSRFESFHLAALEALSAGVPVVTSDRTGVGEVFDRADGFAALPVDDDDVFAERAADVLCDDAWLSGAGARAARRTREVFDPPRAGERLLALHDELALRLRAPSRA